jgi:hypothetical protein
MSEIAIFRQLPVRSVVEGELQAAGQSPADHPAAIIPIRYPESKSCSEPLFLKRYSFEGKTRR